MVAAREPSSLFATRNLPEFRQASTPTWPQVVKSVDWCRVLLEADGLHARFVRVDPLHAGSTERQGACGACLREVLLDRNWTPFSFGRTPA